MDLKADFFHQEGTRQNPNISKTLKKGGFTLDHLKSEIRMELGEDAVPRLAAARHEGELPQTLSVLGGDAAHDLLPIRHGHAAWIEARD
jgi:hypothetical protein